MPRLLLALPLGLAVALAVVSTARADAFADFEQAKALYETQRFEEAARVFERLVDATATDAVHGALSLESRKYLGASYLFLGRRTDAERQFELLLASDPDYEIDPFRFPSEVVATFEQVRARVHDAREHERHDALEREARDREERERARAAQEERLRLLEERARTEVVVHENSRFVAALPFGIGQFQNRRKRLGIALATLEGALLVTMVTSWAIHETLRDEQPDATQLVDARRAERASRLTSWTSSGAFLLTAALGILEAELHFVPSRVERRARPPSPGSGEGEAAVTLGLGPTHLRVAVQF